MVVQGKGHPCLLERICLTLAWNSSGFRLSSWISVCAGCESHLQREKAGVVVSPSQCTQAAAWASYCCLYRSRGGCLGVLLVFPFLPPLPFFAPVSPMCSWKVKKIPSLWMKLGHLILTCCNITAGFVRAAPLGACPLLLHPPSCNCSQMPSSSCKSLGRKE